MFPFQKIGNAHDRIIIGKMLQIPCNQNCATIFYNLIELPVRFIRKGNIHRCRYDRAARLPEPIQQRIDLAGTESEFGTLEHLSVFQHDPMVIARSQVPAENQANRSGGCAASRP